MSRIDTLMNHTTGVANIVLELAHTHTVSQQMHCLKIKNKNVYNQCYAHWLWLKNKKNLALVWLKFCLCGWNSASCTYCRIVVQVRQITALLLVPTVLGCSMAINIFHWCLVRSQLFTLTGSGRFLTVLPSRVDGLYVNCSELVGKEQGRELNALCNLSWKKLREVAAHYQADFWVGVASCCV